MFVLAPLAAVVVALVALLILMGSQYLGKFIGNLVPSWHIPGLGNLRDAVMGLIEDAVITIGDWLDAAIAPVAKVISYPVIAIGTLIDNTISVLTAVLHQMKWVLRTYLPAQLAAVKTWTLTRINELHHILGTAIDAVRTLALTLYAKAIRYIDDSIAVLHHVLGAAIAAAVITLRAEINAARAYAAGLVTALHRYVDSLVAAVEARVMQAVHAVDAFAHAAYADTIGRIAHAVAQLEADIVIAAHEAELAAVTAVETAVTVGIGDVWGDVVSGVEGAIDGAADGFDWIKDELAKLDLSKITDVAGLAALVGVSTAVMTRYLRECGMPNCRNLSALGRDLQELLGMVEGVALFGLITQMVSDPHGAARELQSVLTPIVDDTVHTARELFGVR